jgi:hypothetical protein
MGRGLLTQFPNPERTGCPGPDVLKRIASHEMPLAEAENWFHHLTSCSPCYRDFVQLQAAQRRSHTRAFLAIAAGILIVACLAGWAWFLRQKESSVAQIAVIDLTNRSVARGTEPPATEPPLEIARNVSRLEIDLPLGSEEGSYELRILALNGQTLFTGAGTAKIQKGITKLAVETHLSIRRPGLCILQLRRDGSEWSSYALRLK